MPHVVHALLRRLITPDSARDNARPYTGYAATAQHAETYSSLPHSVPTHTPCCWVCLSEVRISVL
jgi:hypothetical protein